MLKNCILNLIKCKCAQKDKLSSISQFMTFLCLIDCTILPIITIFVSAFSFMKHFDYYTHMISKCCVAPLGAFVAIFNYWNGGSWRKSVMAIIGSSIIYHSHSSHFHNHENDGHNGHSTLLILYSLIGCAMLITGNWKSNKCGSSSIHSHLHDHGCCHNEPQN
ncbi:hypothetical protein BmR1_04g08897 [Babesia microti strain RI]|uniref:MerC domain-containing protein n=1 Tax=Babesia microti (strain RI) TaxID=1133968 RepID=A0A1N6LY90_BABMR|nr:hypothetical protein BmR1_04g08897 [Babesia microti strain RI]SIO73850.1 hypothetical protein BmR1_04g08897 [Babesia microti strain RI]|eukprot:XP_021337903.1 hypothetical protein BmR1_04g08897 [Babesia microti strain RI]